ncbi:Heat shock cognate protein B C-terminal oligomerization [Penicillium malachiteum]|uniref:Heat shock cognate protein B C-terminal oligomerization n=1 Tax=Penicillium malachiteum TaxID=1324776 RepID=UPI0025498FBB|nr:Heat shock cognate protein B C-terminal oligomerization [Penicillium malachiteum]KAJ5730118.1 Heat shock cognate protein B C-terminal oligomerization [Penicillium malachiteum]
MAQAIRPSVLTKSMRCSVTARSFTSSTRSTLNSKGPNNVCAFNSRMEPTQTPRGTLTAQTLSTGIPSINRHFSSTKSASKPNTENKEPGIAGAPDITNHYTIFPRTIPAGPPPASSFKISTADLRREFLQHQSLVHPDKYAAGDLKQHAEGLSARINEAYRTLLDPLQRAQYLLREWHDIDVTAEDAATNHALDADTLMEVMEVQETIEEVGASPEAEEEINSLMKENGERIQACVQLLGDAIDSGEVEAARKECIRLRFWYSVGEGLREWQPGNTDIRLAHSS